MPAGAPAPVGQIQHRFDVAQPQAQGLRLLDELQPIRRLRHVEPVAGGAPRRPREQSHLFVVADRFDRYLGPLGHGSDVGHAILHSQV